MAAHFPKTLKDRASLYANALHEIRMRLRMIEAVQQTSLPPLFIFETCNLQICLCCECLAVACLAAQGDFQSHKAFSDEYRPPVIFKALEALYPNFFPGPSSMTQSTKGEWHFDGGVKRPAIERAEVERLWNMSGAHLHRGSAKRYIRRTNKTPFSEINAVSLKFWQLIADHSITLAPTVEKTTATILHVMIDRLGDAMRLNLYHVDKVKFEIKIEEFQVKI